MSQKIVQTDVLIVGAGPAGAATAVFLGRHGTRTLMISKHPGTADTPRAHLISQHTMEALRDAGLEAECTAAATPGVYTANTFWLRSMAGEELARAWSWGNDPARATDYLTASPCRGMDLPQSKMEPILVAEATRLGAEVRFGWELVSFVQDDDGVTAQIVERLSDAEVTVRAKYMVGADGARSRVVEQLGLPLTGRGGLGLFYNVLCEVDLSRHTVHRQGSLYNVIQPGASAWGPVAVLRMVRPWDRWLIGLVVPHGREDFQPTTEAFVARIREAIGEAGGDAGGEKAGGEAPGGTGALPIRVLSTSQWHVNDIYAERLSAGRVFCMGDAVHRHPPAAALGSNTCVQDAFNLAWKLAYVLKGRAHPRLLETFNDERQPVARQIVARANQTMGHALRMMDLLGGGTRVQLSEADVQAMFNTPEGREKVRLELLEARYNGHSHGVEMTRQYRSAAVVEDGSPPLPALPEPDLYYQPSTRPGSSLPHAWLVRRTPSPLVSTLDLSGQGAFHLFSGHGGQAWREAARHVAAQLQVDLGVTLVGPQLDYEDPYGVWWKLRGVEDAGCVLVRPDHIVGWRSPTLPADPAAALRGVMERLLGAAGSNGR